jgi:hypothetical protein
VPRVNNVNFAISVGTVVPSHVTIIDVPATLIEIRPEWRRHRFFVVRDEIVVVDRSRRIVATVPVGGSSGAQIDRRGGAQGAVQELADLGLEEIRQIQIVLKERGFYTGELDGVFRPEVRLALIEFQRQQGFQATGRIDVQTKTALQISDRTTTGQQGNEGGNQPSTGQGGDRGGDRMQPPANQNMGAGQRSNQSDSQPSSTGQPPANQEMGAGQRGNQSGNQPSTTGQGRERPEQANPDAPAPGAPRSGGQAK